MCEGGEIMVKGGEGRGHEDGEEEGLRPSYSLAAGLTTFVGALLLLFDRAAMIKGGDI